MQEQLNLVIEKHCETIKHNVETLGSMLTAIAGGTDPRTMVAEAEALAHQLKGSCGTAGFHDISRAATTLDDHLKILCRSSEDGVTSGLAEAMKLFQSLDDAASVATPSTSTLYKPV